MKRVLVVDDVPGILAVYEAVGRRLKDPQAEFTFARRADHALELVRSRRFDLIVADMRMQGTSGLGILREARGACPRARRVLTSAYAESARFVEALQGTLIDAYVAKPFHAQDMARVIEDLIPREAPTRKTWVARLGLAGRRTALGVRR